MKVASKKDPGLPRRDHAPPIAGTNSALNSQLKQTVNADGLVPSGGIMGGGAGKKKETF